MEKQKNTIFYLALLISILSIIFIIKVSTPKDNILVSSNNIVQTNTIKNNTNTQKQGLYIKEHYIENYNSLVKIVKGIVINKIKATGYPLSLK